MSNINKELIEQYRTVVLPFVSKILCEQNFEGQGVSDKAAFEQDFNDILNLALLSLRSSPDLISREAVRSKIWKERVEKDAGCNSDYIRGLKTAIGFIDNAPSIPLPDFKAGYKQAILDGKTNFTRPQGEWINPSENPEFSNREFFYDCSICGNTQMDETNFCPNCGADMREGGAE